MPLGYHISADEGLITVHGQGELPLSELVRLGQSLLADTAFDPELPQLLDFRGLRPDPDAGDSLWRFVLGPYREHVAGNVAVVIDDHLESLHCADIYLLTCAIETAELFADYDHAVKWLMRQAFAVRPVLLSEEEYAGADHADGAPE